MGHGHISDFLRAISNRFGVVWGRSRQEVEKPVGGQWSRRAVKPVQDREGFGGWLVGGREVRETPSSECLTRSKTLLMSLLSFSSL